MTNQELNQKVRPDAWLVVTSVLFLSISILMVTSSSMFIAKQHGNGMFYYGVRQGIFIFAGFIIACFTFRISLAQWYRASTYLIPVTFMVLVMVLVPGIGREVNGSMRWIPLGSMNFQPSEMAKLFAMIYIAGYLHRHYDVLKRSTVAMIAPLFVLGLISILLLLEPDFGSTLIILTVGVGMMFVAGISLWRFVLMLGMMLVLMTFVLWSSPYRRARLVSFMDPWEDVYNTGYQLINSLIAIGRGRLGGAGVGESVQKMGYLPEAHTDFIFSIFAEEFGFFGAFILIGLFVLFIVRAYNIAIRSEALGMRFAAYYAYGIGIWVAIQAFIHMSVTMGLLPTKGLTLPLISYGGSSMITMLVALSILFRIDIDSQQAYIQRLKNKAKIKSDLKADAEKKSEEQTE